MQSQRRLGTMKQHLPVKAASHSTIPSRLRASPKPSDSPKPDPLRVNILSTSPSRKSRRYSATPDLKKENSNTRRSLYSNPLKSGEEVVTSPKLRDIEQVRVVTRLGSRPVVEQFARPHRQRLSGTISGAIVNEPNGKKSELQEKLYLSENLIKDLQTQVSALKVELERSQCLNVELQSQNNKLSLDLATAVSKIKALSNNYQVQKHSIGESQIPHLKVVQKPISNKLEISSVEGDAINETSTVKISARPPKHSKQKVADLEGNAPLSMSLPPPPPPPLPPRSSSGAVIAHKAPQLVQIYHSLTKKDGRQDSLRLGKLHTLSAITAHSSIVGEIQNRSAHLLAIKADIETKGDFINGLIDKVLSAAYTDMEDVLKFVDSLDEQLSSLADEQAVLKHFKWPERKADAMREAAVEYRALEHMEREIALYEDDINIPCEAALKKMTGLLDKSERSIQKLIKLRNTVMSSYQYCKIPTDWMLDSGIMSKLKKATMKLVKMYLKRVKMEMEVIRSSDRGFSQEAILLQGLQFAYRTYQFAGGLDSESLCAFEDIRQLGGSGELFINLGTSKE